MMNGGQECVEPSVPARLPKGPRKWWEVRWLPAPRSGYLTPREGAALEREDCKGGMLNCKVTQKRTQEEVQGKIREHRVGVGSIPYVYVTMASLLQLGPGRSCHLAPLLRQAAGGRGP